MIEELARVKVSPDEDLRWVSHLPEVGEPVLVYVKKIAAQKAEIQEIKSNAKKTILAIRREMKIEAAKLEQAITREWSDEEVTNAKRSSSLR